MKSFNRVILIGNLVHDPVLRTVAAGAPALLSFSVAVNESKKAPSGAWTTEPHFFDVTCFGQVAENVAAFKKKGDPVLIEGRLHQSRWETNDGQKRQKVGVLARSVTFLPRSGAAHQQGASDVPPAEGSAFPEAQAIGEDDIPF